MKKAYIFGIALILVGCAGKISQDEMDVKFPVIAEQSSEVVPGDLLVRLNREPSSASSRNGIVRSGLRSLDLNLAKVGALTFERLIPRTEANAARLKDSGLDDLYIVRVPEDTDLREAAEILASSENVSSVSYNVMFDKSDESHPILLSSVAQPTGAYQFNDPLLPKQWNYINTGSHNVASTAEKGADINCAAAWKVCAGDPGIVVAIVDQGVDYGHPDLAANMWVNEGEIPGNGIDDDGNGYVDDIYGYNFVSDCGQITTDLDGDSGHGTHVAGTIAAVNDNGTGVAGIAGGTGNGDGVRLMSCQMFSGKSGGDMFSITRAIVYAADNGASIVQASLGYDGSLVSSESYFRTIAPAIGYAIDYFYKYGGDRKVIDGGLMVFAAGNSGYSGAEYPGACEKCLSVASIGPDMLPAYYTNYGRNVDITAPGGDYTLNATGAAAILSTLPRGIAGDGNEPYGYMQGTSMACPHISGIAALGLSYALKTGKKFTLEQFKSLLLTSVNDLEFYLDGSKNGSSLYQYSRNMGTGLADAWKLLMNIEGTPYLTAKVAEESVLDLKCIFGSSAEYLDYQPVAISKADRTALGVEEEPYVAYGKLHIVCGEYGIGKLTITAVSGGSVISREISVLSRGSVSKEGGWL